MNFVIMGSVALGVFVLVVAGMAIGVIFAKKPLKGSCGGLGQLQDRFGTPMCDICNGDPDDAPSDCKVPLELRQRCHDEGGPKTLLRD